MGRSTYQVSKFIKDLFNWIIKEYKHADLELHGNRTQHMGENNVLIEKLTVVLTKTKESLEKKTELKILSTHKRLN
uniref:Putative ovule protein n=1 Tax=Solanum chacoense TaxID=4108 RepID=A0A0V0HXV9_SOLCH